MGSEIGSAICAKRQVRVVFLVNSNYLFVFLVKCNYLFVAFSTTTYLYTPNVRADIDITTITILSRTRANLSQLQWRLRLQRERIPIQGLEGRPKPGT